MGVDQSNTDPGQGLTAEEKEKQNETDAEFWVWFIEGATLRTKGPLSFLKSKLQNEYKMVLPPQIMESVGAICITTFFKHLVETGIIKEEVAMKVAERASKKSGKATKSKIQD